MAKVVVLWGGDEEDVRPFSTAFQEKVKSEFPNTVIDNRYAGGDARKFPSLLSDLVDVDVIVASGTPAALAAKDAAKGNIPIVFAAVGKPELVEGPKITGVYLVEPESSGRRLEILKEAFPKATSVLVLMNQDNKVHESYWKKTQDVASRLGITLVPLWVRDSQKLNDAFATLKEGVDALIVFPEPRFHSELSEIIAFAARKELPAIYSQRSYVEGGGGLMSYGPNYTDMFQQAAGLVNRILANKGIPDREPVRGYELVIKRSMAEDLRVKIPSGATVI
jgi:putative ABC transport system substrate-binding protein